MAPLSRRASVDACCSTSPDGRSGKRVDQARDVDGRGLTERFNVKGVRVRRRPATDDATSGSDADDVPCGSDLIGQSGVTSSRRRTEEARWIPREKCMERERGTSCAVSSLAAPASERAGADRGARHAFARGPRIPRQFQRAGPLVSVAIGVLRAGGGDGAAGDAGVEPAALVPQPGRPRGPLR